MSITQNINDQNTALQIDRSTFEQVYQLYWEKVYAVCYNNIKEVEPAKGMVQDIFKSLWERREELQIADIQRYLLRSAKFKAFEFIRNKVSKEKHICIKFQDCSTSSNCTEEKVFYNNLTEKVNVLVDTLPCQCKRVFLMSQEGGLSNKEIATSLAITERAVQYHINKALSMLRENLVNYIA